MVSAIGLRLRSHGSVTPTAVGGQPGRGALSAPRSGAAVPVRCHATAVAGSISQSWGAPAAQRAFDNKWKGLVRMMKSWNREQGKPINPSFLIEVMALDVLQPEWGGIYAREIQAFFYTLADRIHENWPDPAGLGPDVSDSMDTQKRDEAKNALLAAGRRADEAIRLEKSGSNEKALRAWKRLFGKHFHLS